ncbi:MIND complex subunit DSN1 Ecym_4401 [Eremothecium cymbalariae DBVPG|uniref:Uncharacterized protein n=1 Tax=Eremothecium cymbalariae (strain CBS 270.75 / DBVPG 7215 / KCTC 17166 / NRRL Y-17582) TaxID=931890 RepID=G8JTV2_ERECY|nr:hypothetical protein Ecym_4401 [Eremothecium cymbalariae DBVPG\
MSEERSYSRTPQRRRSGIHGLKVHTLPTEPSDLKHNSHSNIRSTQSQEEEEDIEDEYSRVKPQSSFETDEDFKFKRRRRKHSALGDRLDSLQDIQNAKWMDNFNSSMQVPQPIPQQVQMGGPSQYMQSPQGRQQAAVMPPPQYMPYMYYYPMPPPMMPMPTSPQRQIENIPSSMQGYPNTSTQPFFPHLAASMGNNQLVIPSAMYPPHYSHESRDPRNSRDRRRSIMSQRGRRLSMLSFQGEDKNVDVMKSEIISPHKDVPESDFYRHIGNTSFGRGLRTRQLFNWCMIRCLRRLEGMDAYRVAKDHASTYVSPQRISMVIIKEFVQDLRKGKIDMDWDCKDVKDIEFNPDDTEDTVLRELFNEDDEGDGVARMHSSVIRKRRRTIKIPNEKNIQNLENLKILQEKLSNLRSEIDLWSTELDKEKYQNIWISVGTKPIGKEVISVPDLELPAIPDSQDIKLKFVQRMDRFQASSHLLASHAKLLGDVLNLKSNKISRCLSVKNNTHKAKDNKKQTRKLLVSLSRTLSNWDQQIQN